MPLRASVILTVSLEVSSGLNSFTTASTSYFEAALIHVFREEAPAPIARGSVVGRGEARFLNQNGFEKFGPPILKVGRIEHSPNCELTNHTANSCARRLEADSFAIKYSVKTP